MYLCWTPGNNLHSEINLWRIGSHNIDIKMTGLFLLVFINCWTAVFLHNSNCYKMISETWVNEGIPGDKIMNQIFLHSFFTKQKSLFFYSTNHILPYIESTERKSSCFESCLLIRKHISNAYYKFNWLIKKNINIMIVKPLGKKHHLLWTFIAVLTKVNLDTYQSLYLSKYNKKKYIHTKYTS